MKRTIGAFFCLAICATAAPAQAQMYWRLEVGYSQPNKAGFKDKDPNVPLICADLFCTAPGTINHIDASYILGGGIGYRFSSSLRGDVTLTYRGGYRLDDYADTRYQADLESTTVMANGYYDFSAGGTKPYVGAGVGVARNKLGELNQIWSGFTSTVPGGTTTNAAFSLMAGIGIPIPGGATLDLGYRYIDLGKFESGRDGVANTRPPMSFPYGGGSGKLTAHELTLGFRF